MSHLASAFITAHLKSIEMILIITLRRITWKPPGRHLLDLQHKHADSVLSNKYRAIMKRFEEGGNGEADSKPAKKRAKAAPTKKNPPVIEIGDEDREEGRDGGEL